MDIIKNQLCYMGIAIIQKNVKKNLKLQKELDKQGFTNEIYNVGCMHWDYRPVSLDRLIKK